MKINLPVTNTEYVLKDTDSVVSKTDQKGIITYINEDFLRISGFTTDELIGSSHNIVRHPDMPPEAFEDFWNSLKAGRPWIGMVKNRCKNGDFYWVLASVTPLYESGKVSGYVSVRTKPGHNQIEAADAAYRRFREGRAGNRKILDGKIVKFNIRKKLNIVKRFSVKSHLTMVIAIMIILLLTVGGMGQFGMKKSQEALRIMYDNSVIPASQISDIQELMFTNQLRLAAAVANPAPGVIQKNTADVEQNNAKITKLWDAYLSNGGLSINFLGSDDKILTDKFAETSHLFVTEGLKPTIAALRANNIPLANKLMVEKVDALYEPVGQAMQALMQMQSDDALVGYRDEVNRYEHTRNIAGALIAAGLILALWLGIALIRAIVRPLNATIGHLDQIAQGNFNNAIEVERHDEIGRVMEALKSMQTKLGYDITESRRIANEALRIKNALDNVSTNVMIADNERNLIYVNKSMIPMFAEAQNDIRRDLPNFDATKLIGSSIDQFHKNTAHQKQLLATFTSTLKTEIKLGVRTFALVANPVIDDRGERLGSVMEWTDRTIELAAEKELAAIVDGAVNGDFTVRMNMQGKTGFFSQLGEGLNKLMQTSETSLNELAHMLRALSQGDLNEKITSEYYGTFGQLKNDANATAEQLKEIILNEVGRVLEALSRGDLTETISNDYPGAFGQLKDDANTTVAKLMEIISQVKDSTDMINTASQEIAQGNADLSQRTEEQASSLEETASSMEELTSTVKQNADNAKQANQLAMNASDIAVKGGKVVGEVVQTMSSISTSSKKIVDIISVIEGIAFQTNILALNAAVEAARAGEQGRGFAVVAGEVRNLAQRSAAAAKEIKHLIDDSVGKVDIGSKQVNQAGATMSEIVTAVKRVTDIMTEIAAASNEQSAGIEQVNQAITQMDEVTQQNAALVEEAAAAAESMQEQANALDEAMGTFKLNNRNGGAVVKQVAKPVASQVVRHVGRHVAQAPNFVAASKKERKLVKASATKNGDWKEF